MSATLKPRLSIRAGILAAVSCLLIGIPVQVGLKWSGALTIPWDVWAWTLGTAGLAAGVWTAIFVHFTIGRRMNRAAQVLDAIAEQNDLLRLPDLGGDELGELAHSINRLCASMTSMQAEMLDQEHHLRSSSLDLSVEVRLARKKRQLELMLRITHAASSGASAEQLVDEVADALSSSIASRELAIFLHDDAAGAWTVKAARGFHETSDVLGRALGDGEGLAGRAAQAGEPTIVRNVRANSDYVAFWDLAPKTGTFAAIPIMYANEAIGILVATRPTERDLSDDDQELLRLAADQIALGLRAIDASRR